MLFGNVGPLLVGNGPALIGDLFRLFNITIMALGCLVVSYTIIVSTVNTAQEGDVMGKKWSSVWIPLRCAVGMGVLLPTHTGYSLIQIMIMKCILMGVGAANHLWTLALRSLDGPPGEHQKKIDSQQVNNLSKDLLKGMVCAHAFNYDATCQASIQHQPVLVYLHNNTLHIGIPNDPYLHSLCGTISLGAPPAHVEVNSWYASTLAAIEHTARSLEDAAHTIFTQADANAWGHSTLLQSTSASLKQALLAAGIALPSPPRVDPINYENGWLYAGSFYFEFTDAAKRKIDYSVPHATFGLPEQVGNAAKIQHDLYQTRVHTFFTQHAPATTPITIPSTASLSGLQNIWSFVKDTFGSALATVLDTFGSATGSKVSLSSAFYSPTALTEADEDPITSLRAWGTSIMIMTENLSGIVIGASLVALATSCATFMAIFGSCSLVTTALALILPIFLILVAVLWTAGLTLALYVPLIPYLVFTFTALTWFVLVVEALVAAPIIALGLVSPAAEVLGKASPAVTLITSIFLRPSLMIIGFILSMQLVRATIALIQYSFTEVIHFLSPTLGIFGQIILIGLYTGLAIAIIHECFSLIYVLPDKIIRWIGHSAEPSSVKASLQEAREGLHKSGETAKSTLGQFTNKFQEKLGKKFEQCSSPPPNSGTTASRNSNAPPSSATGGNS